MTPDITPLAERFRTVRACTERAASALGEADQTIQSMPDASPTKWHRAHTTWFFDTFVVGGGKRRVGDEFAGYDVLFNSYYESVGAMHPRSHRGLITRPDAAAITRYREVIDAKVLELIAAEPDAPHELVQIGLEHEQQHLELLLMDIKHALSLNPLNPSIYPEPPAEKTPPRSVGSWAPVSGGVVRIGQDPHREEFGFDNEKPSHQVFLNDFEIASHLVTNGDWLEFMNDGGYDRHELWLSAGWKAVNDQQWRAPLYWTHHGGGWHHYTHHGNLSVDPGSPVSHVSYFEADAFARWKGARLPTEAEWEHAVATYTPPPEGLPSEHPFGITGLTPQASTETGALVQTFDTLWQWTQSAYLPYPGFIPADGSLGEYNGKFMSGQMVLRGGSCITPVSHTRLTYRNFFSPESRWLYSGIRLAR